MHSANFIILVIHRSMAQLMSARLGGYIENLHWELSVLSKAIHYKNLSGASSHVGLSQPQLSRIISRLESEMGIVLLDRSARRKAGWTPTAVRIAETYARSSRKLAQSLEQIKTHEFPSHLSFGILEGLANFATRFCHQLYQQKEIRWIELNVYDLSELEERFHREELDVIFSSREPDRHKFKHIKTIGWQVLRPQGSASGIRALSPYEKEISIKPRRPETRFFMSNSLAVRKIWIEELEGQGTLPTVIRESRPEQEGEVPVYMIASDIMSPLVWETLQKVKVKFS